MGCKLYFLMKQAQRQPILYLTKQTSFSVRILRYFGELIQDVSFKVSKDRDAKMIGQDNILLGQQKDKVKIKQTQQLSPPVNQMSRQQNEAECRSRKTQLAVFSAEDQTNMQQELDNVTSNVKDSKDSCLTLTNSGLDTQPEKQKAELIQQLQASLEQAIQENQILKKRIILLQCLLVETNLKIEEMTELDKNRVKKKRRYSL